VRKKRIVVVFLGVSLLIAGTPAVIEPEKAAVAGVVGGIKKGIKKVGKGIKKTIKYAKKLLGKVKGFSQAILITPQKLYEQLKKWSYKDDKIEILIPLYVTKEPPEEAVDDEDADLDEGTRVQYYGISGDLGPQGILESYRTVRLMIRIDRAISILGIPITPTGSFFIEQALRKVYNWEPVLHLLDPIFGRGTGEKVANAMRKVLLMGKSALELKPFNVFTIRCLGVIKSMLSGEISQAHGLSLFLRSFIMLLNSVDPDKNVQYIKTSMESLFKKKIFPILEKFFDALQLPMSEFDYITSRERVGKTRLTTIEKTYSTLCMLGRKTVDGERPEFAKRMFYYESQMIPNCSRSLDNTDKEYSVRALQILVRDSVADITSMLSGVIKEGAPAGEEELLLEEEEGPERGVAGEIQNRLAIIKEKLEPRFAALKELLKKSKEKIRASGYAKDYIDEVDALLEIVESYQNSFAPIFSQVTWKANIDVPEGKTRYQAIDAYGAGESTLEVISGHITEPDKFVGGLFGSFIKNATKEPPPSEDVFEGEEGEEEYLDEYGTEDYGDEYTEETEYEEVEWGSGIG